MADFITYIKDLEYENTILRIINDYDDLQLDENEFNKYVLLIKRWINECQIDKLKEELRNETDIKRKEEINDIIIKLKRGSEE